MTILYTCDNNYIWLAGVSALSICEKNKDVENLDFYLLGDGISDENIYKFDEMLKSYCRTITIVNVPQIDVPENLKKSRWPKSAYIRLFSGHLLPKEIKRVLYLGALS